MAIPPLMREPERARLFSSTSGFGGTLIQQKISRISMDELSMGMSHDYEVAIEEGATLVRLGTALFGERRG